MNYPRKTRSGSICLAALLVSALPLAAAITYVDATDGVAGNTTGSPADINDTFTPVPQAVVADGLWDVRGFGNGTTIYQNVGTTPGVDDAHRLRTSVSGLAAATYDVYAFFWSDNSNGWRMGASLTNDQPDLTVYMPGDTDVTQYYAGADGTVFSTALAENPFDTGVMVAEGNRRLYAIYLGTATGTGFDVFIDDDPTMAGQSERTWYDGIGYAVVPEPSSMALGGLGMLGLMLRRRRQF